MGASEPVDLSALRLLLLSAAAKLRECYDMLERHEEERRERVYQEELEKAGAVEVVPMVQEERGEVARKRGGRRGRTPLGLAGPGYLGKDHDKSKRAAFIPHAKMSPEKAEESFRKTKRAVQRASGVRPAPGERRSVTPSPDWTPVPEGEARQVDVDGGGLFEELGGEGMW